MSASQDWPARVAVVGAGAMGATFGAGFAAAGIPTVFIDRNEALVAAINAHGVTVRGVPGERTVRAEAFIHADGIAPADLVLILVDSAATPAAALSARLLLARGGTVLTLQNGIGNDEALGSVFAPSEIAVGSTYNSAATISPGTVEHTHLGETVIGRVDGAVEERDREIAAAFTNAGFPAEAVPNVTGHVWLKFVLNCALNPLCAATGMVPKEVAADENASALLEAVLGEIMSVVDAKGIALPCEDAPQLVRDHAAERDNRPSMLQHVEAGRPPELGALNEALVNEARALGLDLPVNRTLSMLVRAIAARHAAQRARA